MVSPFSLTLIILLSLTSARVEAQGIKSARLLDLLIRDYALKSSGVRFKTGKLQTVQLPANSSRHQMRFRCGSLRRYGAQVKEFHLGIGVTVQPCVERLVYVRQNLDLNWSPIYYANYDLSGYQLVSPILGLLAYNSGSDVNVSDSFEIGIHAGEKPITIDFSNASTTAYGFRPLCASFENDGRVIIKDPESLSVCVAKRHGHYGLVIKSPPAPPPSMQLIKRKIGLWKVVVGSSVGTALGVKKKARMEEMERRAYEEEALQVSMVGHVRAPTAAVSRTVPIIEREHKSYPS
uniref:Xylanase inhibitor C-terminal domain-containing protein n=1 Tax=Salix viminalis TaxID=40686 RepID=A0A6N2JY40_SALVM